MGTCAKCPGETELEIVDVVEIERCKQCHGLLLDRGELGLLVKQKIDDADEDLGMAGEMNPKPARCYPCNRYMESRTIAGGVKVEACPKCGVVFLDAGELETIQGSRG